MVDCLNMGGLSLALPIFKVMGKIKDLRNKFERIYEEQEKELEDIIRRGEQAIVDMNKGQLMAGVNSDGSGLGQYASKSYAEMKRTLNPRGVVDLKLTGSFHDNFFVAVELPLTIWSYDSKTDDLVKKYGRNIFGLTEENKRAFAAGYVKNELLKFYKRVLRIQ